MKDHNNQEIERGTYLHRNGENVYQVVDLGDGVLRCYQPGEVFRIKKDEKPRVLEEELANELILLKDPRTISIHLEIHRYDLLRPLDSIPKHPEEATYAQSQHKCTDNLVVRCASQLVKAGFGKLSIHPPK